MVAAVLVSGFRRHAGALVLAARDEHGAAAGGLGRGECAAVEALVPSVSSRSFTVAGTMLRAQTIKPARRDQPT
jgi:hypothetical protein